MRARIHYGRPADLVRDHDQQLSRGGLLLRVPPPLGLGRGVLIDVELVLPDGQVLRGRAPVTQVVGKSAVAVGLRAGAVPGLVAAVSAARAHMKAPGEAPTHQWVEDEPPPPDGGLELPAEAPAEASEEFEGELELPAELGDDAADDDEHAQAADPAPDDDGPPADDDPPEHEAAGEDEGDPRRIAGDAPARVKSANLAKKIALALHGTKDERAAILRDVNKLFHPYVLRNPNLGLDEVLAMAKMTTLAGEILKTIAERREWASRPEIALALVRNPKCPAPVAVKLLGYVAPADLRQLAKDTKTRPVIQSAARKRLI